MLGAMAVIGSSLSIGIVRMVRWDQMTLREALQTARAPSAAFSGVPMVLEEMGRRFHAFDSILLTVDRVPRIFEHSGRPVLLDAALSGFVPRLLLPGKSASLRAQEFSVTIWAADPNAAGNPTPIAPSMAGDVYDAQGWSELALAACLWGLLVGIADRWRGRSSPLIAAMIVALFGLQCAASVERDFVTTVATFLQTNVALVFGVWLSRTLGARASGRAARPPLRPGPVREPRSLTA